MMMRGSYLKVEVYITLASMLLWVLAAFFCDPGSFVRALSSRAVGWTFLYLLYSFILSLWLKTGFVSSIGGTLGYMQLFAGILMLNYYEFEREKKFEKILYAVLLVWLFFCIKASVFYFHNPYAARNIEVLNGGLTQFGNLAIGGGYPLAYGSVVIAVFLSGVLASISMENLKIRALIILVISMLVYLVFATGSTITLLALFAGFSLNILIYLGNVIGKKDVSKKYIWYGIVLLLLVLTLFNLQSLGLWIMDITSGFNGLLAKRIELLARFLVSGTGEGTLQVRRTLYLQSLRTFFEYPVFGSAIEYGLGQTPVIGDHSELLDSLGRIGAIGSFFYFLIFFESIRKVRLYNKNLNLWPCILSFLIMFLLNPFHSAQSNFALLFIVPAIGLIVRRRNQEE